MALLGPLAAVVVDEVEGSGAVQPGPLLDALRRVFLADGDVAPADHACGLVVLALGAGRDAANLRQCLAADGVVAPAAAVEAGVEVGPDVADAPQERRYGQGYRSAGQAIHTQRGGHLSGRTQPEALLVVAVPEYPLPLAQEVAQLAPATNACFGCFVGEVVFENVYAKPPLALPIEVAAQ